MKDGPAKTGSARGRSALRALRHWLASRLLLAAITLLGLGATSPFWPEGAVLGTFGRMLDSLAPQLLGLALIASLLAALTALPRRLPTVVALLTMLATIGVGSELLRRQGRLASGADPAYSAAARAAPPASAPSAIEVLWFNILYENTTPPAELAQAVIDSGADVVVIGEADPLRPVMADLRDAFPYQDGCTGRNCAILTLSRLPLRDLDHAPSSNPGRLLRFAVTPPATEAGPSVGSDAARPLPLTLIAAHFAKPWFYGYLEEDRWYLVDFIDRAPPGPVLVMGDFNAADWSLPVRKILRHTGLRPPAWPVATWPVWAGAFGVPIDHLFVRSARLENLRPWGADLGSNHRGLRAKVVWGGTG